MIFQVKGCRDSLCFVSDRTGLIVAEYRHGDGHLVYGNGKNIFVVLPKLHTYDGNQRFSSFEIGWIWPISKN